MRGVDPNPVLFDRYISFMGKFINSSRRLCNNYLQRVLFCWYLGCTPLLPFVTQIWQIYAIVLSLNVLYAFFAPTYTATIPLATTAAERSQAIALSSATYQLLGVLGPGLAESIAAFVGTKQVFFQGWHYLFNGDNPHCDATRTTDGRAVPTDS
jgi:MFS family permease